MTNNDFNTETDRLMKEGREYARMFTSSIETKKENVKEKKE